MIVWRQNILPLGRFKAMFLAGVLFVKKNARMRQEDMNHERIHSRQFTELMLLSLVVTIPLVLVSWWIPLLSPLAFYAWYGIEWLVRLPFGNAYRNISFEREAYSNQGNTEYLSTRRLYSFMKYLRGNV